MCKDLRNCKLWDSVAINCAIVSHMHIIIVYKITGVVVIILLILSSCRLAKNFPLYAVCFLTSLFALRV